MKDRIAGVFWLIVIVSIPSRQRETSVVLIRN